MDPIYPWLDPIEVRALANQLLRPVKPPAVSVPDVGFGDAFVGFASNPSFPQPPPPPLEAVTDSSPPFTAVGEILPEPGPAPESVPANGPFLERIHLFRDWMRHQFNASDIFILDHEGAVIFDESNHGRLHFVARSLAFASRRPGTTIGNVHVKISAGTTLEVIPVETAHGCLFLGAVVPEAMAPTAVTVVMKALSERAFPNPG